MRDKTQTLPNERRVVITRVFDAPRELVWKVWTDPKHLAQWWGGDGFTTTTSAYECKPGGVWRFVMHGPDGTDYPEWISWTEIVPPKRIALVHGEFRDDPNAFASVLTFTPEGTPAGTATRIEMRTVFPSKELRDEAVAKYHAIEGGQQTLGKLATYVADTMREGASR